MSFSIPAKAKLKGANFIREVFERGAGIPGFISFGIGNPAAEAIPVALIQKTFKDIIDEHPLELLQYGPMIGDGHLMELTQKRLVEKKGFNPEGQAMLLSNGAGQLLGLVPRSLCDDGDEVYMDEFTFTNGINAVRNAGAKAVGIPMDQDGMIPEALAEAAKSGKGKYIYLIPNFHNPTGITMPEERRRAIYQVACQYDLLIYEDDPYGEIQFAGQSQAPFKSFDVENRVLYVGSYSKTLSAGLRVGFMFGPQEVVNTIQAIKNSSDGQMPLITQKVIARILDTVDYDQQIANVRRVYKEKCHAMMDVFRKEASSKVTITEPTGGMFAWMTLPEGVDCDAFFEACMDKKVGIITSAAFAVDDHKPGRSFRLSYTVPTIPVIEEGMHLLCQVTKEFCGE